MNKDKILINFIEYHFSLMEKRRDYWNSDYNYYFDNILFFYHSSFDVKYRCGARIEFIHHIENYFPQYNQSYIRHYVTQWALHNLSTSS